MMSYQANLSVIARRVLLVIIAQLKQPSTHHRVQEAIIHHLVHLTARFVRQDFTAKAT